MKKRGALLGSIVAPRLILTMKSLPLHLSDFKHPLDLWSWLARTYPHWFQMADHRRMMFRMLSRIAGEEAGR